MDELKKVEVVAAIIIKEDKVLAAKRGYGEHEGKWEFPGGKIEVGESHKQALVREIKEELNADINVLIDLKKIECDCEKFHLIMHTYICSLKDKLESVKHDENHLEHSEIRWLDENNLDSVDWLPADVEAVKAYKKLILRDE